MLRLVSDSEDGFLLNLAPHREPFSLYNKLELFGRPEPSEFAQVIAQNAHTQKRKPAG